TRQLDELAALIDRKATYQDILAATRALKQEVIVTFNLPVGPNEAPNLALGKAVYAAHCASCHGSKGFGDGPAGAGLEPGPRNFHDAQVMTISSPFKFYNTLITGIEGTAMNSYEAVLSPGELWSVSFYLTGLRYQGL